MRLFAAICFPEEIKARLEEVLTELSRQAEGNFTRPENLHLTLAFLGETPRLRAAQAAMHSVKGSPFVLTAKGLGRFRRPGGDICWMGLLPCPELLAVQEQLASALRAAGFPLEGRPFTPHLTLGREVLLHPGFRLDTFSQTLPDLRIPVKRLCLMESRRDGGKLVYREISAVELPAKG